MQTSNEYYGALNNRFDARSAALYALGYAYSFVNVPGGTIGVFSSNRAGFKPYTITASNVLYAEGRAWEDTIAGAMRAVGK